MKHQQMLFLSSMEPTRLNTLVMLKVMSVSVYPSFPTKRQPGITESGAPGRARLECAQQMLSVWLTGQEICSSEI